MTNILIVDDSKTICNTLKKLIEEKLNYNTIICHNKKEAEGFLKNTDLYISVALLDLGLPDAQNGEIIDFVIDNYSIPTIVLTGSKDKESLFRDKNIVDYVIKEGIHSYEYAISLVNRIIKNKELNVFVLSKDIQLANEQIKLLKNYKLNTSFFTNSSKMIESLKDEINTKILIIDNSIMDIELNVLINSIRLNYAKDELKIIIISSFEYRDEVPKLLKYGADDVIYKGFTNEEYYAKLNVNLENLDLFEDINNKANKDFLTGAYNRRYFFNEGYEKFKQKDNVKLFMIDIDKFKNINDTYGHDIGDLAIKEVIRIVNIHLKNIDCILSRFGGEEFCAVVFDMDDKSFQDLLENIRAAFENNILKTNDKEIKYTVSIGYTINKGENLDAMIIDADKGLYKAKNSGRNQVRS